MLYKDYKRSIKQQMPEVPMHMCCRTKVTCMITYDILTTEHVTFVYYLIIIYFLIDLFICLFI